MARAEQLAVRLRVVSKSYRVGSGHVPAVAGVSLDVRTGEFVAVTGPSGSGKTTLLNLIAGLELPDAGSVELAGRELASLSDDERSDLRMRNIGFVFQSFHLFPTLTVEENVAWPAGFVERRWRDARVRASAILERVGIDRGMLPRLPATLSGGEQQRVAIARALVSEPMLLLADEPTGNLDTGTADSILDLLQTLNRRGGLTVVLVTHNPRAAARAARVLALRDGRLSAERAAANA